MGRESLVLQYREDRAEWPVFRGNFQQPGVAVSSPRIWTTEALTYHYQQIGMRAGYEDHLYAYNFRRGQAHKLDGMCIFKIYIITLLHSDSSVA
jgi:hypothetical protein